MQQYEGALDLYSYFLRGPLPCIFVISRPMNKNVREIWQIANFVFKLYAKFTP